MLLLVALALAGTLVIGPGTIVVVADIKSSDPNAATRTLVGEVCQVGMDGLASTGDGWWAGGLDCANGSAYGFTAVSVAVVGDAALPRSVSAGAVAAELGSSITFPARLEGATGLAVPIPPAALPLAPAGPSTPAGAIDRALVVGEPVTILAVHPEDAFYNDRAAIVGKTCYPTDAMTLYDGGWHGGPLACWDGATYYFYKAAMGADPSHVPVDPAMLGGGVDVIQHGTRVKILDVSPEDAFYDDRKKLVGKSCQVDGDLHQQDMAGIWYGGGVLCKKDSYYFYKVSVEVKP
ncbi:MAG: hypothetical protein FJ090_02110 [Deltaproteobacteria bacterium]|nr:hypothetical protein [Deltaproteobacteria bacterium]